MVLAWYNGEESSSDPQGVGYPPDYYLGMRLFFFDTDTTENPYGLPVFGTWDMHENLVENRWHYYYDGTLWPSSSGLSVKYVDRVLIYTLEPFYADFTADPLSGDVPLTVQFSDASLGATTWAWDFDNDGTVDSTEPNPAWTYASGGTYTVSLTVMGDAATDTETKLDYINVIDIPVADFAADATLGAIPFTVQFTDLSTANPTSWAWDFDNDGTVDATEQNPAWTYDAPGTYTVSLTVTNTYGTDTETKVDYIQVAGAAPIAAFEAPVRSGMIPFAVQFIDQSANLPTTWAWDFGDRSTSTEPNPIHLYEKKGSYTVTLTVTNDLGSDRSTSPLPVPRSARPLNSPRT
jgi:PKD repeat protein